MESSVLKKSYKAEAINRWRKKRSTTYRDSYIVNHVDTTPTHVKRRKSNDASSSNRIIKTTSQPQNFKDGRSLLEKVPLEPTLLPAQPPCIYCRAKKIYHESLNICCRNGTISLPDTPAPDILKELFDSNTEEAKLFRTCIRTINNHFAFTSMGVKYDKKLSRRNKGIYTFKIQGQMYHFVEDLESSKHLQLYFHDTDDQVAKRLEECPRLTESLSKKIITLLKDNAYAKFFRRLSEMENLDNYNIVLRSMPGVDQRVCNKPDVSQVAALWVEGEENGETSNRDIRVYTHGGYCHAVQYYYACYDPLQYPILFPFGEIGWHQGIKKIRKGYRDLYTNSFCTNQSISADCVDNVDELLSKEQEALCASSNEDEFVSVREYYAYKLQMRDLETILLRSGRLLQQYIVDMYVKLESQRLDFHRLQQEEIRQEYMQGIEDALVSGETEGSKIGQRVYLPASFIGGPRYMKKRYIDALTLVQKFGKPDIFLTVTCNPNWPEIRQLLTENEEVQNRPDLIARVFNAKLDMLKDELLKKNIFGKVAAYTYVIEFQKRGLPHAHFLLILQSEFKMYRPEEYDKIVCAEIPDKNVSPYLYSIVKKHMIHGPCGELDKTCPCMINKGKCRFSYPKQFCERTKQVANAFPIYQRRDNGRRVKVRGHNLDNRWVVPYNPYLIAKFNCHINVEICSTIRAVKYIYKYVCKGHDRIGFHVNTTNSENVIDEIEQFRMARWVSPPEAAWRIFGFSIGEIKPAVINLQLHLENQHFVNFNKKVKLRNIVKNPQKHKTMLTEFFFMNRTDEEAQKLNLTYVEFPEYFVWMSTEKYWRRRKQRDTIGRIVTAHPSEGERYYLRILLLHVRCPKSFNDLKTYKGQHATTFREAALMRGYLEENDSQDLCLKEASEFKMPYELRRLFANLLAFCCPSNPRDLWLKYESQMSEDFYKAKAGNATEIRRMVLRQIADFLAAMGKNINDFGLEPPEFLVFENCRDTRELTSEKNITVSQEDLNTINMLNKKQRQAFEIIHNRIFENKPGVFFIDGPGGTGKSFLYRALLAAVRSKGFMALATATSGIAASLLPGGRTAHSRFKIPIELSEQNGCKVSKQSSLGILLRECKLIIWDEAPMAKKTAIESLNKLLKDMLDSDELFGGKVVVFGGDFRQILPVVRKGNRIETIEASLVKSKLWPHFEKLELTENMRARLDPMFTRFLLRVGDGDEPVDDNDVMQIPISLTLNDNQPLSQLDDLINIVYPNITLNNFASYSPNRAILTTKNNFVDEINNLLINRFPGELFEYLSFDEAVNPSQRGQFEDIINSLTPNGLPAHRLLLKINAPIILLRNLDPTEGLCNGTRLICKNLTRNVIHAEIAVGDFKGKQVFIHRIPLKPPKDDQYPVPYTRTQFPVRLSFAMTINKAQGQTLDFVGIYLKEPVFSHGQLYVALSRARTSSNVKLLIKPSFFDGASNNRTKNIVYKEVLRESKVIESNAKYVHAIMSRKFLQIQQINTETRGWTALIQVVERTKVLTGRPPKNTKFRRFQLTDTEGTKVTALVYGTDIYELEEKNKLLLYKRYYVSNAEVKEADPKYLVGDYPFSWTITKRHLIEEVKEPVPPQFSCRIDIQKYQNLFRFAETENLQNVLGIVIHVFPVKKTQGSQTRDVVIVNEEKIPMILTLWNEFESNEGAQLAASVANGNIILAMRVRVTTFNYLSLTTRLPSAVLINPPMKEAATLKQWSVDQKNVLHSFVTKEAFKDPLVVLPPPSEKDIISIQEALATLKVNKSAWIRGVASLTIDQKSLWFTACINCQKEISAPINWDINCTLCREDSKVIARCRFVIAIKDETGVLEAMVTGIEAEHLLPFTGEEMSIAEAENKNILPEIVAGFYKNPITCFVRHYEGTYSNITADKYSVVKIYTEKEIKKIIVSCTPIKGKEKITSMDEHLFTPTAKLMLETINLSTPKPTAKTTTKVVSTSTKRPLIFTAQEEEQVTLSQTKQSDMSIVSNEESTRGKIVGKDATNPTEQHHSSPAKKMKDQD